MTASTEEFQMNNSTVRDVQYDPIEQYTKEAAIPRVSNHAYTSFCLLSSVRANVSRMSDVYSLQVRVQAKRKILTKKKMRE